VGGATGDDDDVSAAAAEAWAESPESEVVVVMVFERDGVWMTWSGSHRRVDFC
jgi:hypothetical protein